MALKISVVLFLGALILSGFWILQQSWERTVELGAPFPSEASREEQILRDFFSEEMAQRKLAHLALSDLPDFEPVAQPRPDLSEVIARYGVPDAVVVEDLVTFGVPQRGRVHYYGRLGLATRADSEHQIFWIRIAGR